MIKRAMECTRRFDAVVGVWFCTKSLLATYNLVRRDDIVIFEYSRTSSGWSKCAVAG